MKTFAKRSMAIALAAVLLLCTGAVAFADGGEKLSDRGIVFISDRVMAGSGLFDSTLPEMISDALGSELKSVCMADDTGKLYEMFSGRQFPPETEISVKESAYVVIGTGMADLLTALLVCREENENAAYREYVTAADICAADYARELAVIIAGVRELNPAASVFVLGVYDPFCTEDRAGEFGGATAEAVARFNGTIAAQTQTSGGIYVNIADITSVFSYKDVATGCDTLYDLLFAAAPSESGQEYIASVVALEIETRASVSPVTASVSVEGSVEGKQLELTYSIMNNPGFSEAEFELQYDREFWDLVGVEPGILSEGTVYHAESGAVEYAGGTETADGTLFSARFVAVDGFSGENGVTLCCDLRDAQGEAVAVSAPETYSVAASEIWVDTPAATGRSFGITFELNGLSGACTACLDGRETAVSRNGTEATVMAENGDARLLTVYEYNTDAADRNLRYPVAMYTWRLHFSGDGYTAERLPELDNVLQYAGIAISTADADGAELRAISGIPTDVRKALLSTGIDGLTVTEYGTLASWAKELQGGELTLQNAAAVSCAFRTGTRDSVLRETDGVTQFSGIISAGGTENAAEELVLRPYLILSDRDGNTMTLYGGAVCRTVSYIAYRNRNAYDIGTAEDTLLQALIAADPASRNYE